MKASNDGRPLLPGERLVSPRQAEEINQRALVAGCLVEVWLRLPDEEALALAQFVKRVGWSEFRQNAVDEAEAYTIRAAIDLLRKALAESGYAPR
jgi:dissimilatory sulfite reductase (desulfoviridin) alpha/beta subunit